MRRITRKNPQQPSMLDSLMNSISRMSAIAAVSGYGAIIGSLTAISLLVVSVTVVRLSWNRSDPTGLIKGNALDVVLGDDIATFDSSGFSALCPSETVNFCSEVTLLQNEITIINDYLNITNITTTTLSTLAYTNVAPFMSAVTNGKGALDTLVTQELLTESQLTTINNTVNSLVLFNGTVTLSTLSYTNGASFMSGVTHGKGGLDALVTQEQLTGTQLTAMNVTLNSLVATNGTVTLSSLPYTNGAFFMANVTNGKNSFDNVVGELLVHDGEITTLQSQITTLVAPTSRTFYVSKTYGNDGTCDATKLKPCNTLSKTLEFYPNVTNEFSQNTILFDNGLYTETNFISIPPNTIFAGNEIGTQIIFGAGAGLHPTAWSYTGIGYTSFHRFALIRCSGAPCAFTTADVAPSVPIFAFFIFYNCTLDAVTPFSFTKTYILGSYFSLSMESVVVSGLTLVLQDLTAIQWVLSSDIYAPIQINYNNSFTYGGIDTTIRMNGMIPHASLSVNNYFALIVDWEIINVVVAGAGTLTRNYISGAVINVHGDVLSLGAINGGLISTGAGSGSTQYLTYAYGMGYTPANTTYWAVSGVPIQISDALDKIASRLYNLETLLTPSKYTLTGFGTGTNTIDGTSCLFSATFGSATAYISGPNVFWHDASTITFNGSSTTTFRFQFSAYIAYVYSASVGTVGAYNAALVGPSWFASGNVIVPITTSGSAGEGGTMTYVDIVTLNPGDALTMGIGITVSAGATFTSCNLFTLTSNRYLSFEQL